MKKTTNRFTIFVRLVAILLLPLFLFVFCLFAIGSLIIDLCSKHKDEQYLSAKESKMRATDRTNTRRHKLLDLICSYFKILFG